MFKRLLVAFLCLGLWFGLITWAEGRGIGSLGDPIPQHSHLYRDVRFHLVEILNNKEGKLTCADLETQEVGLDLIFEPDLDYFHAFQIVEDKGKEIGLKPIPFEHLKGKIGVLSYCDFCKKALAFKEEHWIRKEDKK